MSDSPDTVCDDPPRNLNGAKPAESDGAKPPSARKIYEFLAESTMFRSVPKSSLKRLSALASTNSVTAGGHLFEAGDACDTLHFLFSGTGVLVRVAPDGRQRVLHRAMPGEMVGAVPFFDGKGYPATFSAEKDCVFVSFQRTDLLKLLANNPEVSLAIIGGIVARLREMACIVERISFEDTRQRLWKFLMERSSPEAKGEFPRVVDPLPTRERIAQAIGTVREVVSRRLSGLVEGGFIAIDGRRVTLLKPED